MDQILRQPSQEAVGIKGSPCHQESHGGVPRGSRDSSRAAKNSFALKYKKSTKISLETFSIFLKHPKKKKTTKNKEGVSVRVSSPTTQPMAHCQSWGGLRARRGCRRFYGNNGLHGEGGSGRRQKAPQGWGRMLRTSAPGCWPGRPPRIPPLCANQSPFHHTRQLRGLCSMQSRLS